MARLRCEGAPSSCTLGARTLVGRAPTATLRLADPSVSAEHASVFWHEGAWRVRDLGSTNGTFLDGERLHAGRRYTLADGSILAFGEATPALTWVLDGVEPPGARARREADGATRCARAELLVLPDDEVARATIFTDEGGSWVVEIGAETAFVDDGEALMVGAERWHLELPAVPGEGGASTTVPVGAGLRVLEACALELRVSRDEEYVEASVRCGAELLPLAPRAFHYTLLVLARRRLADAALPPAERGWIYADELARALGTTKPKVNLDICRARQQLAEAGIEGAGRLVQRRLTSHQLRIGLDRLTVEALSR